jgi:hypothetical protein
MRKFSLRRTLCVRPLLLAIGLTAISCTENSPPAKPDGNPNAVLPSEMKLLQQPAPGSEQTIVRSSPGVTVDMGTPNAPAAAPTPTTPQATAATPANPAAAAPEQIASATPSARVPSAVAPAAQPKPKPAVPQGDAVTPPADAHWTLLVAAFDGPAHIEQARAAREQLKAATNSNKFYVVHEETKSTIYYGFYKEIDSNSKDSKQAQADKDYLKSLKTTDGQSPLSMVYFTPVAGQDPQAPAEWDLAKIGRSPDHYWSLQIAAYTSDGRAEAPGDVADRKTAAVESVRELRKHGYEAYFYHGDTISSVCIGAWPENSVKRQDGGDAAGNAATVNPHQPILVAPELPKGVTEVRTPEGEKVKALAPKLEVLNPKMLAAMKQFPTHALNGYDIMREYGSGAKKQTLPDPSVIVLLPEKKTDVPAATALPSDADLKLLQLGGGNLANQPAQPGMGKLRSVGE